MKTLNGLLLVGLVLSLSACVGTRQQASIDFRPPQGSYNVIVIQPDISVGLVTAGGSIEQRQDWTDQARENVLQALAEQQAERGGHIKIAATREETGADPALVGDLVALHNSVGQAIQMHKYSASTLPTKKDRFDWTLGAGAVEFGAATHYDYALFLRAQDSFASNGRMALQAVSTVGCVVVGFCYMPNGGIQLAFVSLVDLKTGNVVWFNSLSATVGDMRTPEGARDMVKGLLGQMKPAKPPIAGRT